MKYAINKEFGIFRKFKPPLNKLTFRLALAMPKCLRSTKSVSAEKVKIIGDGGKKIPLYIFSPKKAKGKLPAIIFLHGGGFVFKGAPYHYKLAKIYAEKANAKVIYVDYRLAFQGEFLISLKDCLSAYNFVLQNADKLNIDVHGLGIVGDSAGGYLALSLIETLSKSDAFLPKYQMLIYPVVDSEMTSQSMKEFSGTPMWNSFANAKMWRIYSKGNKVYNPLSGDLSFMPATYIETAQFDCLHDEGIFLHDKMSACAVKCILNETQGTMHGFDICMSAQTTEKAIRRRVEVLQEFIKESKIKNG